VNDSVEGEALKRDAVLWQKSLHPAPRIRVVQLAYDNLLEELASFKGSGQIDVAMIDDPWVPRLAENCDRPDSDPEQSPCALQPLEHSKHGLDATLAARGDFVGRTREVGNDGSHLYAVPYIANVQLLAFDSQVVGEQSTESWEGVATAARKVFENHRGNQDGPFYGYTLRSRMGNPAVTDFLPILWSFGGAVIGETKDANCDAVYNAPASENACVSFGTDSATLSALNLMRTLGQTAPTAYTYFNERQSNAYLATGRAAFGIVWCAWVPQIRRATPNDEVTHLKLAQVPKSGRQNVAAGAVETVQGSPVLGAWLLGIHRRADPTNLELAEDFIAWATDRAQLVRKWKEKVSASGYPSGLAPVRQSAFDQLKSDPELSPLEKEDLFAEEKALQNARPRYRSPFWPEIERTLGHFIAESNAGLIEPPCAAEVGRRELQKILARHYSVKWTTTSVPVGCEHVR
jgi:multiple sugar transport system substrate-binding protein